MYYEHKEKRGGFPIHPSWWTGEGKSSRVRGIYQLVPAKMVRPFNRCSCDDFLGFFLWAADRWWRWWWWWWWCPSWVQSRRNPAAARGFAMNYQLLLLVLFFLLLPTNPIPARTSSSSSSSCLLFLPRARVLYGRATHMRSTGVSHRSIHPLPMAHTAER